MVKLGKMSCFDKIFFVSISFDEKYEKVKNRYTEVETEDKSRG